ncbi:ABC transporter [Lewinellaceae bacterium SD302]|nr:ABC transporter [Lewinellaceae bacterium SD302]
MKELWRSLMSVFRDNPYLYLLRLSWRYAEGHRRQFMIIYGLFVCSNLIHSSLPILYGIFIDHLQTADQDALAGAWVYAGVYLTLNLLFWAFHWPARLLERRVAFHLSGNLLQGSYEQLVELPLSWHRNHHSGDTINRVRRAYQALRSFFDNGFAYFQTFARMVIALIGLVYFSPLFGGIALVIAFFIMVTILVFDRPYIEAGLEANERENRLVAGLTDNLGNITTVTSLRLGNRTAEWIKSRTQRILTPFLRQTKINEYKWFTVNMLAGLMYGLVTVGYVYQNYVPGELFLIGGLVTLLGFVQQFTSVLSSLTAQYTSVVQFRTDLASIDPIQTAHAEQGRPMTQSGGQRDWKDIRVEHLSFDYPDAEPDQIGLRDVNIRIARGQRIALIGESGSGKSTVLTLLRGLYPADNFQLAFDGTVTDKLTDLFGQTTLITQHPEIFEDTIESNITLGFDYPATARQRAVNTTVLNEVIHQLPNGLETFLNEGGANLSGGQRQCLSLARGLLAGEQSSLLLLDEPTSSLDPRTEQLLYQRLFKAYPDHTIVSTLHRLHLLRHFDYVYLMELGRVVEHGTPDELSRNSERFKKMLSEQEVLA